MALPFAYRWIFANEEAGLEGFLPEIDEVD
jgi:hypothetical protein